MHSMTFSMHYVLQQWGPLNHVSFIHIHDDVIKWKHFRVTGHLCVTGNSLVPGEFPAQRPVTRSFDVFFDLRLNKRLSKQPWGWWFETLSRLLWRLCIDSSRFTIISSSVTYWLISVCCIIYSAHPLPKVHRLVFVSSSGCHQMLLYCCLAYSYVYRRWVI